MSVHLEHKPLIFPKQEQQFNKQGNLCELVTYSTEKVLVFYNLNFLKIQDCGANFSNTTFKPFICFPNPIWTDLKISG